MLSLKENVNNWSLFFRFVPVKSCLDRNHETALTDNFYTEENSRSELNYVLCTKDVCVKGIWLCRLHVFSKKLLFASTYIKSGYNSKRLTTQSLFRTRSAIHQSSTEQLSDLIMKYIFE